MSSENKITAKAAIQISKPIHEIFDAIVNPNHMKHYFIADSTGIMKEGETINWSFPEFPDTFPVSVIKVDSPSIISFDWSGGVQGQKVNIMLEPMDAHQTLIRVEEFQYELNDAGVTQALQQTEGWANFLACLKAYLEYNINLRKGAFDFMKNVH